MSDAINTIGGGVTVKPVAQSPVRAPSPETPVKVPDTLAKSVNDGTRQADKLSPRLLDDPLAGIVVSQQLDSNGYIVQQTPSSSVLAYLRNGLTIDGYPKDSTVA